MHIKRYKDKIEEVLAEKLNSKDSNQLMGRTRTNRLTFFQKQSERDYLYKPVNNIELGCAYLSQIRYYYFENIKDDELAYICSIPAYNTGIGNVSRTLCGKPYTNPAADVANSMTANELYKKLTSDLKYEEARNYLERVWKYKEKYKG